MDSKHIKRIAPIFWVSHSDWSRHASLCVDRDRLPASYENWLDGAEQTAETFAMQGWEVIKVRVDLDEFVAWCKTKRLDIDSQARIRYANEIAAAQVRARDETKQ